MRVACLSPVIVQHATSAQKKLAWRLFFLDMISIWFQKMESCFSLSSSSVMSTKFWRHILLLYFHMFLHLSVLSWNIKHVDPVLHIFNGFHIFFGQEF
jgi:hypothetical protein